MRGVAVCWLSVGERTVCLRGRCRLMGARPAALRRGTPRAIQHYTSTTILVLQYACLTCRATIQYELRTSIHSYSEYQVQYQICVFEQYGVYNSYVVRLYTTSSRISPKSSAFFRKLIW